MMPQAPYKYSIPRFEGESFADPVKVRRLLLSHSDGRFWSWVADAARNQKEMAEARQATGDDPEAMARIEAALAIHRSAIAELEGKIASAAYVAFGVPPMDTDTGDGVTEGEVLQVVRDFLEYAEKKD